MHRVAVIGVGNMAKAIIRGIVSSGIAVSSISLFDKFSSQYDDLADLSYEFYFEQNIKDSVRDADIVLLSVKPQNYCEVLNEISELENCSDKIYISIAAGIRSQEVSDALKGANVVRVLPNLPMTVGKGVTLICKNEKVERNVFEYIKSLFLACGEITMIEENDMNKYIGVTSSSPAYVFKFIDAIYNGAIQQGLDSEELLSVICDTVIGSAVLLKNSAISPEELITKVASKGGTTEQALKKLDEFNFEQAVFSAMEACTARAEELGNNKN